MEGQLDGRIQSQGVTVGLSEMAQRGGRDKVLGFSATLYVVYLIGAQETFAEWMDR